MASSLQALSNAIKNATTREKPARNVKDLEEEEDESEKEGNVLTSTGNTKGTFKCRRTENINKGGFKNSGRPKYLERGNGAYAGPHITCLSPTPEILILDKYTTTKSLSVRAEQPISSDDQSPSSVKRTIGYPYKLIALIVHQGNHSSGHYLTFRRIPTSLNTF
ncbi:hypothetical protein PSTT_11430 [Puccinia striiformis]|uniref:Peptidase C19 ubiquitin carboxyl-terminal hydrolase domain-containing protein n=1 Tax=Puccinia striiformis TaxID=27350 RepID=A0A2S4V0D0_9BASI|nr:hypothetical protein PSTT_11430 [Puccinia striiformis]